MVLHPPRNKKQVATIIATDAFILVSLDFPFPEIEKGSRNEIRAGPVSRLFAGAQIAGTADVADHTLPPLRYEVAAH